MSKFGWSYPPGAASDPYAPYNQSEAPCAICGEFEDACICPECTQCGAIGDPKCYEYDHHVQPMIRSSEQEYSLAWNEAHWEQRSRCEAEAEALAQKHWEDALRAAEWGLE